MPQQERRLVGLRPEQPGHVVELRLRGWINNTDAVFDAEVYRTSTGWQGSSRVDEKATIEPKEYIPVARTVSFRSDHQHLGRNGVEDDRPQRRPLHASAWKGVRWSVQPAHARSAGPGGWARCSEAHRLHASAFSCVEEHELIAHHPHGAETRLLARWRPSGRQSKSNAALSPASINLRLNVHCLRRLYLGEDRTDDSSQPPLAVPPRKGSPAGVPGARRRAAFLSISCP